MFKKIVTISCIFFLSLLLSSCTSVSLLSISDSNVLDFVTKVGVENANKRIYELYSIELDSSQIGTWEIAKRTNLAIYIYYISPEIEINNKEIFVILEYVIPLTAEKAEMNFVGYKFFTTGENYLHNYR